MAAKPIKSMKLHYTTMQFLKIIICYSLPVIILDFLFVEEGDKSFSTTVFIAAMSHAVSFEVVFNLILKGQYHAIFSNTLKIEKMLFG